MFQKYPQPPLKDFGFEKFPPTPPEKIILKPPCNKLILNLT